MGLVASSNLSARLGYCEHNLQQKVEMVLTRSGLPVRIPAMVNTQNIIKAIHRDKKRSGDRLHFVLMRDVGDVFIEEGVSQATVVETLEEITVKG